MSKEHAYAYEAGYRDGSINYELEHCPACTNVADLQEALAENAKLREEFNKMDVWHSKELTSAMAENSKLREELDDQAGYDQMLRDILCQQTERCIKAEADNAKLRELARDLHMAYVETLNECESLNEGLIWEYSGSIEDDVAKSRAKFKADRHRFDDALCELGIEVSK